MIFFEQDSVFFIFPELNGRTQDNSKSHIRLLNILILRTFAINTCPEQNCNKNILIEDCGTSGNTPIEK